MPLNDEANFQINVRAPEGTSLQATRLIGERIARETRGMPEVAYTLTTIGDNQQRTPNLAQIYVKLVNPDQRKESQADMVARTRREIVANQPKDLRIDVSDVDSFNSGQSQKAVQYVINGPNLEALAGYSDHIIAKLKEVPGAVDVDTSLVLGKPEVRLHVLRDKASDLGVQVSDISNTVRLLVGGIKVSTYEEGGEDYDVRIRAHAGRPFASRAPQAHDGAHPARWRCAPQ